MKHTTIIIPAYNEERRISSTIDAYVDFFQSFAKQYQMKTSLFIAVNGSTDRTNDVCKEKQKQYPDADIRVHEWKDKIGKGGAIHNAFGCISEGDYVGFVDADNSTSPQEFAKLIDAITGHDGAIASRWMKGSVVANRTSLLRKTASKLISLFVRILFHMPYKDTQCGAKLFTLSSIHDILGSLKVKNMAFDVELLYVLQKRGYDVIEVPTHWIAYDKNTNSYTSPWQFLRTGFKMGFSIFKIRFKKYSSTKIS